MEIEERDGEMANSKGRISLEQACAEAAERICAIEKNPKIIKCHICGFQCLDYNYLTAHYLQSHPGSVVPVQVHFFVNGKQCQLIVEPQQTLKEVLQFSLGLTGAKHMCDRGACGSCTVIIDGRPTLSCNTLAVSCEGKKIETVEGIALNPKWKPLIDAYCKWDAMQCGYCTPGFLVTAKALIDRNPHPTKEEIKLALSGNICICGTYPRHAQAILEAVTFMVEEGTNNG
jgi:xanthine dehydrogenase YagT iron-sulfur-binding subunit